MSGLTAGGGGVAARPLAAALGYATRGWAVFPLHSIISGRCSCRGGDCPHPAKHPIARHGVHEATTDERNVRSWWDRWPWANIGVATGTASGVVVIDVDPAHGGAVSLAHLQSLMGSLPDTLTAHTGGGGFHLLYSHPGGQLRNTAGRLPGVAEPLSGIDLRADGGYIVAAPSRHRSGASYSWIDPDTPVAAAPTWLRPPVQRPFPTGSSNQPPRWGAGSRYGLFRPPRGGRRCRPRDGGGPQQPAQPCRVLPRDAGHRRRTRRGPGRGCVAGRRSQRRTSGARGLGHHPQRPPGRGGRTATATRRLNSYRRPRCPRAGG